MSDYRDEAMRNLVLLSTVGSTARGLSTPDSDIDRMGVYVEPRECVMGLRPLEHFIEQTQAKGARATKNDEQTTLYSLRKFARLAAKGNPSITELFYIDPDDETSAGRDLREHAHLFLSKQSATHYLGYMVSQIQRLEGTRGQKNVKRPELEEKYGFDTKYSGQILLLGMQGVEILTTGKLTLPLPESQAEILRAVRRGEGWTKESVIEAAEEYVGAIKAAEKSSDLPDEPDTAEIDKLLVQLHLRTWELTI